MSMQYWIYIGWALVIGMLGGIHVPINGALGKAINSTLVATLTFYGIGFALAATACLIWFDRMPFLALRTVPRWYFLAGVISVVVVGSSTFLIPRIGAITLFVIVLTMQLVSRSVISHFGWLESPVMPFNWVRAMGVAFLVVGALLVVRR